MADSKGTNTHSKAQKAPSSMSRLLGAIALLVVTIAALVTLLFMTRRHVAATQQIAQDLVREVERESQLRSIEKLIEDITEERAVVSNQFVPADDVVRFINRIENLNAQISANLVIGSVTEDAPNAEGIGAIHMQLQAIGAWQDVLQAIALIESLPVATQVGNITLRAGDAGWTSTFSITTATRATE